MTASVACYQVLDMLDGNVYCNGFSDRTIQMSLWKFLPSAKDAISIIHDLQNLCRSIYPIYATQGWHFFVDDPKNGGFGQHLHTNRI